MEALRFKDDSISALKSTVDSYRSKSVMLEERQEYLERSLNVYIQDSKKEKEPEEQRLDNLARVAIAAVGCEACVGVAPSTAARATQALCAAVLLVPAFAMCCSECSFIKRHCRRGCCG